MPSNDSAWPETNVCCHDLGLHEDACVRPAGCVRSPQEPPQFTDEMVERVASELALLDDYNPNQAHPMAWLGIAEQYRIAARRVLSAAFNEPIETHYLQALPPDSHRGLCGAQDPVIDLRPYEGAITCPDCLDLWEAGYQGPRTRRWPVVRRVAFLALKRSLRHV